MSDIKARVSAAVEACRDAISQVAERSQAYIDAHDAYLDLTVRDSSLVKSRIKDRIARAHDEG